MPCDSRYLRSAALLISACLLGCETVQSPQDAISAPGLSPTPPGIASIMVPIMDLDSTYEGFPGLFYEGSNTPPAAHDAQAAIQALAIQPLNKQGQPTSPAAGGRYVFLSIGFSNTAEKWCTTTGSGVSCNAWTFMGQAKVHPSVRRASGGLRFINGAYKSGTTLKWDNPTDADYARVKKVLTSAGNSELQVQIVYLEIAHSFPMIGLPSASADAFNLLRNAANQLRAMKVRYPNLRQVYISPRDYAGWAINNLNPEPYAYESGFTVKWLVQAQINQLATGVMDPLAGDLSLSVAPWIAWGPNLWATTTPRSDGLFWQRSEYDQEGYHHTTSGETKAATFMLDFFLNSPYSSCWIRTGTTCP